MAKHTLTGRITILLGPDGAHIEIVDDLSGIMVCAVDVDGPNTLAALGRQGMVPGTITMYRTMDAPLGYVSEHKTEVIDFSGLAPFGYVVAGKDWAAFAKAEQAIIAPFLVDGWSLTRGSGSSADWRNNHQSKGNGRYAVHFSRHVEPHTGQPWIDRPDPDPDPDPITKPAPSTDRVPSTSKGQPHGKRQR